MTIAMRHVVKFPANVQGTKGIDVSRKNGTFTFKLDYEDLTPAASVASNVNVAFQDPFTGEMGVTSLSSALNSNSNIQAIANASTVANKLGYWNGVSSYALADFSAFGRTWIGIADAAAGRTALGVPATTDLGTAAAANVGDFATAAQGSTADSAVQPGDLATVATSGSYNDLTGKPTLGTAAAAATSDFATAAQGTKADNALVKSVNLNDVADKVAARQNLNLGAWSWALSQDISHQDLNTSRDLGIYWGTDVANSPDTAQYYVFENVSDSNWGYQIAQNFFSDAVYFRRCNSGTWQPWQQFSFAGSGGTGDMVKSTYDPNSIAADAFNSAYTKFLQSGTGAVSQAVQTKLRHVVDVEDFGAVGDGVTNDYQAFQYALNSGARVVRALRGPYLLSTGWIGIPKDVTLQGPLNNPGEILPSTSADYQNRVGTLRLDSAACRLVPNHGSTIQGFRIVRSGMTLPFPDLATATAGVAAFAGTAIYWGTTQQDVNLRDLMILGFEWAITGVGERPHIHNVKFDCTNGIAITGSTDIPTISDCWGFEFTTTHQSWTNNAILKRGGIAFYYHDTADWARLINCFSFGYKYGVVVDNCDNPQIINCGMDDTSDVTANSVGFLVQGTSKEALLLGCQAGQKESGFVYNYSGTPTDERVIMKVIGCNSWGISSMHHATTGGRILLSGNYMRAGGSGGATGIYADPTSGSVTAIGNVIDNLVNPINVSGAALSRSRFVGNAFPNCTNTVFEPEVEQGAVRAGGSSGDTVTVPLGCSRLLLTPSGALAALTIALPVNPADKQKITINTTQTITALTFNTGGRTIYPGPSSSMSPYDFQSYIYDASMDAWIMADRFVS